MWKEIEAWDTQISMLVEFVHIAYATLMFKLGMGTSTHFPSKGGKRGQNGIT